MKRTILYLILLITALPTVIYSQADSWRYVGPHRYALGGYSNYIADITFVDSLNGYAIGDYNPILLKTTDGGATWQRKRTNTYGIELNFINAHTGWINGFEKLSKTEDGGESWTIKLQATDIGYPNCYFRNLQFISEQTGFVVGDKYIGKTQDAGNSWVNITPVSIDSNWRKVFFIDENTGWAFNDDSILVRTVNGGQTWLTSYLAGIENISAIHFYSHTEGVLVSSDRVYKSTNGGASWVLVSANAMSAYSTKIGAGGFIYTSDGHQTISFSLDTGRTWAVKPLSMVNQSVYFINPAVGFHGYNDMYATTDSGNTWHADLQDYPSYSPIIDFGQRSDDTLVSVTVLGACEFDQLLNWTQYCGNGTLAIQNVSATCYFEETYELNRFENGIPTFTMGGYSLAYAQSKDSFIVASIYNGGSPVLRTTDGGLHWDTIFNMGILGNVYSGEWNSLRTAFYERDIYCKFMSWDVGVVAYTINGGALTQEYITLDGGNTWKTFSPSTSYICATKISPSNQLFSLRSENYEYKLWKLNAQKEWEFVVEFLVQGTEDYSEGMPDFGWSPDGILWANPLRSSPVGKHVYSLDDGVTWTEYPEFFNYRFSCLKSTYDNRFFAGTGGGDWLEYNPANSGCKIKGNVFYDLNKNGVQDATEVAAVGYPVNISPITKTIYCGQTGDFVTFVDSGAYSISPAPLTNFNSFPVSRQAVFFNQTGVSINNFALQPIDTNIRDLRLSIFEDWRTAPGFEHGTYISYSNLGVQPMQPTITFVKNPLLTYNIAFPAVSSQSGDTLVWNLPVINPFESTTIYLETMVSLSAAIGDSLSNAARIDPLPGDNNPADNIVTSSFIVAGSFDPNAKDVSPKVIVANQSTAPVNLEYTIHFQNTGTDTTHFVIVKDKLPASLNIASLRVIAASHPYKYHVEDDGVLVFTFNDCRLPDSTTDADNSQGFVKFIISPKAGMLNVPVISNTANIYFDYNTPVATNTAQTTVDGFVSSIAKMHGDMQVAIYPNPSNSLVNVESDGMFTLQLFDILGQPVLSIESISQKATFDVSHLASGMYYIKIKKEGKLQGYSLSVMAR